MSTAGLTPMMKQYLEIKKEYSDAILFFRLGDFYEMFFEDAITASREMEITLTGREGGREERIPMCGVPYHAADGYIAKLISKGYKVAICEQVEDPKAVKGIVRREVIRVVTPGTILDQSMLEEKQYNFLLGVHREEETWGLAVVDISTGLFMITQFQGASGRTRLLEEIMRLRPSEILLSPKLYEDESLTGEVRDISRALVSPYHNWAFEADTAYKTLTTHFGTMSLDGFGCNPYPLGVRAAGAVLDYLKETQKTSLDHLNRLSPYDIADYMILDGATRRNLELTRTIREDSRKGSLLSILDHTVTAMGGRMLKSWIEQPLIDLNRINERLDVVEELTGDIYLRTDLKKNLQEVYDLERLTSRVAYGTANARDLVALRQSLAVAPNIKQLLRAVKSPGLASVREGIDPLADLSDLINAAIDDTPPFSIREGGFIRPGYNEELDRFRGASREAKEFIAALEAKERERTGIKSLKVGFNKVFGFYIEVTKSNLSSVPDDYIRKQTLANAERYLTPELKEYESLVLGAEEKINNLEYELFVQVRDKINAEITRIQGTARAMAALDAFVSLAESAVRGNYVKPRVNDGDKIIIREGRHPVVEKSLKDQWFVPNDTELDREDCCQAIITGPNMAGKSTYMRQVALIILMAQIGSFVPAAEAQLGLVDRIFTRIGASDDLATGQSTFMVEMNEVANILHNATARSFVILDEIGRGTSTFDGLSIAWAVAEYLYDANKVGAKTLFATHYHELTKLAEEFPRIKNYNIAVKEQGDQITFLRKIIPGGADRSYGIQVARLAGLPKEVIARAREILSTLEYQAGGKTLLEVSATKKETETEAGSGLAYVQEVPAPNPVAQLSFLQPPAEQEILDRIKNLNISNLTPLEALIKLSEFQEKLK